MQSIHEYLRNLRIQKNMTEQELAHRAGILVSQVVSLEKGDLQKLPGGCVLKQVLVRIGEILEVSETEMKELLHSAHCYNTRSMTKPRPRFTTLSRASLFTGVGLVVMLYLGIEVHGMVASPKLDIQNPSENQVTDEETVVVQGMTAPETLVMVNGMKVSVDREGNFKETIHVKEGVNEIIVRGVSKRGGEAQISRKIMRTN
jgi:transcriptional regulator with XRE-family HTH domain